MTALALAVLLLARPAGAMTGNPGGGAAEFLTVGAGARALGMGEAFGPIAEGPDSMYWNPAGLAAMTEPEVSFTHTEMLDSFHHEFAAYGHPVEALGGTIGGAATIWTVDPIQSRTNANVLTNSFSPHSEAFAIGYARSFWEHNDIPTRDREFFQDKYDSPFTPRPVHDRAEELWEGSMRAGVALKGVFETIQDRTAKAVAADAGFLFYPYQFDGLTLSLVMRNIGSHPVYDREVEALPAEVDGGVAYDVRWPDHRLLFAFETAVPYYGAPYAKVGAEYGTRAGEASQAFFRVGYKTLSAPYLGVLTGATFGVGFRVRSFSADIGFEPMGELNNILRISLQYRFSAGGYVPSPAAPSGDSGGSYDRRGGAVGPRDDLGRAHYVWPR